MKALCKVLCLYDVAKQLNGAVVEDKDRAAACATRAHSLQAVQIQRVWSCKTSRIV